MVTGRFAAFLDYLVDNLLITTIFVYGTVFITGTFTLSVWTLLGIITVISVVFALIRCLWFDGKAEDEY